MKPWQQKLGVLAVTIPVIAERIPKRGDIYLDQTGKLRQCIDTPISRRAQTRLIVMEAHVMRHKNKTSYEYGENLDD